MRWVGELVGFQAEAGAFTSGGNVSDVTALAAAREHALPDTRVTVWPAGGLRSTAQRSALLRDAGGGALGIGSANVRSLPIDTAAGWSRRRRSRHRGRPRGRVVPVAVVATAGTTLTGAVDPPGDLADVCAERGVLVPRRRRLWPAGRGGPGDGRAVHGVDRADSVTVDAHKWLYLPKACGVVLVRRPRRSRRALAHEEAYFPHERNEPHAVDITLEYSRPFRALKLWLAFRVHGAAAFRAAIDATSGRLSCSTARSRRDPSSSRSVGLRRSRSSRSVTSAGVDARRPQRVARPHAASRRPRVGGARPCGRDRCVSALCIVNFRTSDDDVRALVDLACELGAR